jgi:hypothetical protein
MFGPCIWVIFSIQGKKLLRVHLAGAQRDRLHRHIMDRRRGGVVMMVMIVVVLMMIVTMMIMVVVVMMVIAIRTADMVFVAMFQELRIVLQRAFEIEGAEVQHLLQVHIRAFGAIDAGRGIDHADDLLDLAGFFWRDEVGLVEQDDVGEGDLILGLAAVLQAQRQVLGVDQGHHGVELGLGASRRRP